MAIEDILGEFIGVLARELIDLIPKLIIAVLIIVAGFLVLRILGSLVRKMLEFADMDGLIKKYAGIELPIPFNSIVMGLLYLGVALAIVFGLINVFLGEQFIELANSIVIYGARIISVVLITLILFTAFSAVIERIRIESRLKGYLLFIVMLLLTAMLIDITALSEPVKQSLYIGLSVGIGASLAVFAVWFFFHEYFDKLLERKRK